MRPALCVSLFVSACVSTPAVREVGAEPLERWLEGASLLLIGERDASIPALLQAAELLSRHAASPFEGNIESEPGRPTGVSLEPRLPTPGLALSIASSLAASDPAVLASVTRAAGSLPPSAGSGPRVVARVLGPDGRDFIELGAGTGEVVVLSEGRSVLDVWVVDETQRTVCAATGHGRVTCRFDSDSERRCDVVVRNSGPLAERYVLVVR